MDCSILLHANSNYFTASAGNLGRVDYISEFEFDLFIRPDTCNPRFRVWFNFTVENVRETQVSMLLFYIVLSDIIEEGFFPNSYNVTQTYNLRTLNWCKESSVFSHIIEYKMSC